MTPSLFRRMACWLYEGVLLFGVTFIAGYLFSALTQTRNAMQNRNGLQAFLLIVFAIYFVWFWAKGQTLAMKTWNIRLQGLDGRPITQARALLRYALSWAWFLPPLLATAPFSLPVSEILVISVGWIVFWATTSRLHPKRQFWHDAWAHTELVSVNRTAR